MAYTIVNMTDFKRRDDMYKMMGRFNKNTKTIFPDVLAYAAKETSETLKLAFVSYKNKQNADQALQNCAPFHEEDAGELSHIFSP